MKAEPARTEIPGELRLEMHARLLRVRIASRRLAELYREQEMRTPAHFGLGQEAVAVGVVTALRPGDVVYSHHRAHNHYLASGGSVYELAAELYGREAGCSRGRGGSAHLTAQAVGFIASTAILGETIAIATGSALAFSMRGERRLAVSFFGEAACEEGIFYESINYAAIRRLPVLYVCENNLYSTESPLSVRQPAGTELCERARSFKLKAERVDGNDLAAVYEASARLADGLRRGEGPAFLECMTYRWLEHVGPHFDHEAGRTYRSREEVESWMQRCPVKRSAAEIIRLGVADEAALAALSNGITRDVEDAVKRARAADPPPQGDLYADVW